MRRPLDLRLPAPRRWPLVALAVSVSVHVLLFLFGAVQAWLPELARRAPLPASATPADTIPIAFLTPAPPVRHLPSPPKTPHRPPRKPVEAPLVTPVPAPVEPPKAPPVDTATAPGPKPPAPAPAPTPSPPAAAPAPGRIGPELARGKLWVTPLPLPPQELAQRLRKSNAQLVDSAVTSIVQSYLDSMANEPGNRGAALPDWTTRIAGKKFGLDSNHLYVAGLKIPAAVLALLPIPGGNIDQNRAYNHMLELRADIQQAAQRADNLAEFKERIREIRLRKEREEEFERHRRQAPADDGGAGRDSSAAGSRGKKSGGSAQQ